MNETYRKYPEACKRTTNKWRDNSASIDTNYFYTKITLTSWSKKKLVEYIILLQKEKLNRMAEKIKIKEL